MHKYYDILYLFMPTKPMDLTGKRFGKLLAIKIHERRPYRAYVWECKCDCGNICHVQASKLLTGYTKSCGCLRHNPPPNKTHGLTKDRLYPVWLQMRYRCKNPTNQSYKQYGARGISVCKEWENFQTFYDWMIAHEWHPGLSIDRIDPDGDYCPENCRLTTEDIQQNNRRNNIRIEFMGETHTVSEWANILGIKRETIAARYYRGMDVEDVLSPINLTTKKKFE